MPRHRSPQLNARAALWRQVATLAGVGHAELLLQLADGPSQPHDFILSELCLVCCASQLAAQREMCISEQP